MITWAIVPVKPLIRAKSRLADVLSPKERENLSVKMLLRTLTVLKSTPDINNVLVISRDTQVLSLARVQGVHTVQESGQPELNNALARASTLLQSWGVEATLVLPADLPLLCREDLERIIAYGKYSGTVVISPDSVEDGTNALFLYPPSLIDYQYGNGSFQRHIDAAKQEQAILHIYESERIQLDVDTPNDLIYYQMMAAKLGESAIDYTTSLDEEIQLVPDGGSNG
ncbi:MAG: 2-phospho-L-lactate guanylyltransferase [Chloroflexi bacterium]|nr:2-phospho-L-lactate guanylyltransferase [Chloroflexota bacterium]